VAKKLYDICIVRQTYQKDGKDKKSWLNIGSVMQSDNGPFILLDVAVNYAAFPRQEGKNMLMASLFKPQEKRSSEPF
jgi:hypothetical protein